MRAVRSCKGRSRSGAANRPFFGYVHVMKGNPIMSDSELIEALYRRFHSAPERIFPDRIAHLRIDDLPFKDPDGRPFGNVKHLVRGDDKSGAAFDIFRLGWFGGRVWELVVVD